MIKKKLGSNAKFTLLALGGLAGGLANGLLGAGGGIIMTFVLEKAMEDEIERRDIFANVIAATLPISLLSTAIYAGKGNISTERFSSFVIPAIAGGLVGAFLLSRISTVWLKRIFALLVIWSGIYMVMR
ncbi:MAG: sulfite exporter TauE/SafE family protein [Ruminococcaceae bacterium]|nr:sulfite exporter TauE/SafE family protein [Oscillospiraceae bacterium]